MTPRTSVPHNLRVAGKKKKRVNASKKKPEKLSPAALDADYTRRINALYDKLKTCLKYEETGIKLTIAQLVDEHDKQSEAVRLNLVGKKKKRGRPRKDR